MAEPPFQPPGGERAELVETHVSWVFLAGERAYKLRKPVVMPFLDYGTLARRKQMAEEELRLGRRLAPRIYLGVRPLFRGRSGLTLEGEGEPAEYAVEMRRFSPEQTLDARLREGAVGAELVRSLGARIAAFHASEPPCSGWGPEQVARAVDDNFASLLELDAGPELGGLIHAGHRFAAAFLDGRRPELARRAKTSVRDGHGDLRAEHVVLDGDIEIFDPVEFDPALRRIDVSADLAFLVMDLERHGRPDLAGQLVSGYRAAGGDPGESSLVYFYAAYRAWVRAKVAWLRAGQHRLDAGDVAEVCELAELARRLAWRARGPRTLVVCGPAASGKTLLAGRLADQVGLVHLSSDVARKRLLGLEPGELAPLEGYGEEWSRRTYGELGRAAAAEVERTRSVVVDATFRSRAHRDAFAAAYGERAPAPLFLECRAPAAVLAERAARREGEPGQASDAGPAIALEQLETFEALDEIAPAQHLVLRTDRPLTEVIDELEAALDERLLAR